MPHKYQANIQFEYDIDSVLMGYILGILSQFQLLFFLASLNMML